MGIIIIGSILTAYVIGNRYYIADSEFGGLSHPFNHHIIIH